MPCKPPQNLEHCRARVRGAHAPLSHFAPSIWHHTVGLHYCRYIGNGKCVPVLARFVCLSLARVGECRTAIHLVRLDATLCSRYTHQQFPGLMRRRRILLAFIVLMLAVASNLFLFATFDANCFRISACQNACESTHSNCTETDFTCMKK